MQPAGRYASFDYCFNYFQSFRESNRLNVLVDSDHIQTGCLQVAFYLASWGMLRGSSFLLGKSIKFYEPLINLVASFDKAIWAIDVNSYTDTNIQLLLSCKLAIVEALGKSNNPSNTLVSKIMLGVFGNVPAFDTLFSIGFGLNWFNEKSLGHLAKYYQDNRPILDQYQIPTYDFVTGQPTKRLYTKAKLIDMIGFIEGWLQSQETITS